MTTCRSCGAPVRWVQDGYGKNQILDEKPEKRWVFNASTGVWSIEDTYVSHFATCPDAEKWRRNAGKKDER